LESRLDGERGRFRAHPRYGPCFAFLGRKGRFDALVSDLGSRVRRLSQAAAELAAGAPDILPLALASGYGSHEAFTRLSRCLWPTAGGGAQALQP
jgi:hypothetical protein